MATKANLISAVNGFITSIVNITKHRNSMLEVVNELYGSNQLNDTQATTNVVTLVLSDTLYNLTFTKTGRMVYVNGIIINNNSIIPNNTVIANFTNSEFAPQNGKQFRIVGFIDANNNNIPFIFENIESNQRIKNTKQVPIAEQYYINGFYLTNQ
ncbi:hypothetical protein UFOVP299_7 [uncultured Caudovirales phage]|uniref:Uncharacterized protein n=1 Tax=uncultured Caudovirales phage TaxID=2100421 RepID=A0A6J5LNP6_9CAUD|nr:hypothetical protein UFOVP299_7 [uncultured Caudovirales phage]